MACLRHTCRVAVIGVLLSLGLRGLAGAGDPLPGLTPAEAEAFASGRAAFLAQDTIESGLGPVFNGRSCAGCHRNPTVGGDSGARVTRFGTADGKKFDPLLSGGGSLIQRQGLGLVGDCLYEGEVVPPNATVVASRLTTPVFGLGLIEAIEDKALHLVAAKQPKGIKGNVHQVKDVGQPTRPGRFGWKAQAATIDQFSGDALLNEQGVTSPNFPLENCPNGDCALLRCDPVPDPEDDGTVVKALTDFMQLLAPLPRGEITPAVEAGAQVFHDVGCAGCHTPAHMTGDSAVAALHHVTFAPYSDFLLHDMGVLGDGIEQGQASGTEMRTAPLWGLRFRQQFLHDGRTTNLVEAILAHEGQGRAAADAVRALDGQALQALVDFLGSL